MAKATGWKTCWGCCGAKDAEEKKEGPAVAESKKPRYTKITQQELDACKPVLTKGVVTLVFLLVAVVFIPVGVVCLYYGLQAKEVVYRYDQECLPNLTDNAARQAYLWQNGGDNAKLSCHVSLVIESDMPGPIYIYYQIDGMFQNHRRYVRSHLDLQLAAKGNWESQVSSDTLAQSCVPMIYYQQNTSQLINPCGLVAWSYFNDTYNLTLKPQDKSRLAEQVPISQQGIAFQSDIDYRFANYTPQNFNPELNSDRGGANISATVKEDEKFMVWMRLSHMKRFRKLYGQIDGPLHVGDVLRIGIVNQYNTYSFDGEKAIVLSTTTWLGGHSPFLGIAYLSCGGMSLVFALVYQIITVVRPRQFADTHRLRRRAGPVK